MHLLLYSFIVYEQFSETEHEKWTLDQNFKIDCILKMFAFKSSHTCLLCFTNNIQLFIVLILCCFECSMTKGQCALRMLLFNLNP